MHMMSAGELRLQHGLCRRQYRRGRHGKAAGLCEACQKILQLERRHCNAAAKAAFCAQQLLNPRRRSWVQGLAWHVLPTPDATPPPPPSFSFFFSFFFLAAAMTDCRCVQHNAIFVSRKAGGERGPGLSRARQRWVARSSFAVESIAGWQLHKTKRMTGCRQHGP